MSRKLVKNKIKKRTYDTTYAKKSHSLFFIWLACFFISMMAFCLIADVYTSMSNEMITKVMLLLTALAIVILFYIIYRTEKIYWLNRISYDEAVYMTREERKRYALLQLQRAIYAFFATMVYTVMGIYLHTPSLLDSIAVAIILGVMAFSSTNVKVIEK